MNVLIPIPNKDFDPTEVAIPWSLLNKNGIEIYFSTPDGNKGEADQRMLDGMDLGILKKYSEPEKTPVLPTTK